VLVWHTGCYVAFFFFPAKCFEISGLSADGGQSPLSLARARDEYKKEYL
jgi:hypothetical protein